MTYYRVDYQADDCEPTYEIVRAESGPAAMKQVSDKLDGRGHFINDIYWQDASLDEAIKAADISGAFWR